MVTVRIPNTAEFGDYTLTLSATTCDGETTVTDEFVVTFKPEIVNCAEAVLTAPAIIVDGVLQLTLYQEEEIQFEVATVDPLYQDCAIVYKFSTEAGDLYDLS